MARATTSEGEKVPEIQSLTARVEQLTQDVDWWNTAIIWALVFAAMAAVAVVVTTRIALVRAKQLSDMQDKLIRAKDGQLALDLKGKDEKILGLEKQAADAKAAQQKVEIELAKQQERAASAELKLAQIAKAREPRGFQLGARMAEFVASLKDKGEGVEVEIWYQPDDSEALLFAQQIRAGLSSAHWRVSQPIPIPANAKQSHLPSVPSVLQLPPALRVGAQPFGVSLIVNPLLLSPEEDSPLNVLQRAFQELYLGDVGGSTDAILSENKIRVIVSPQAPWQINPPDSRRHPD
jgi:hypothetical protein